METDIIADMNPPAVNQTSPDLDQVSEAIVNAFPRLSATDQQLAIKLYRLLAEGEPVSREHLAQALTLPVAEVNRTLSNWPGVYDDDDHNIIGFWGLTINEMRHHLDLNGKTLYTWCAWDTLFIPELLNTIADVTSTCAVTGETIRLTVSPTAAKAHQPGDVMVSFLIPDQTEFQQDLTASFCHFVYFFHSRGVAEEWASRNAGTFLLSLEEAFTIGRKMNAAQYKDVLGKQGMSW